MGRYNGRLRKKNIKETKNDQFIIRNDHKKVRNILKKDAKSLTKIEKDILEKNEDFVKKSEKYRKAAILKKSRLLEIEDDDSIVTQQCIELAEALQNSKHVVVYTGAGISTSANIPDFRGTDGIWTKLNSKVKVELEQNLTKAQPTSAHMVLRNLYEQGFIKHVVSQNCDGLHLRSGIPQHGLSEIHGNMYLEICTQCDKKVYRIFDVTEKTSLHRHKTGRHCDSCQEGLSDTIVHFGERSKLRWPHNWQGAIENAEKSDMILCLGSSLKVLRSYKQLWMMNRPKHKRPKLYIVNLQWTPKDSQAFMKIHSRLDFVMETISRLLGLSIPIYSYDNDPLYALATPNGYEGQRMPIPQVFFNKFRSSASTNGDKSAISKNEINSENSTDVSSNSKEFEIILKNCTGIKEESKNDRFCQEDKYLRHEIDILDNNSVQTLHKNGVSSFNMLDKKPVNALSKTCMSALTVGTLPTIPSHIDCNNVPAWFGKGVRTKLRAGKKRKRIK